jgi:hypothetical protein
LAQSRASAAKLVKLQHAYADLALTGGNAFAAAHEDRAMLQGLYRDAYALYEAGHAAGGNFAALAGVEFGELERTLEGIGWLLADPATRARVGTSKWFSVGPEGLVAHG